MVTLHKKRKRKKERKKEKGDSSARFLIFLNIVIQ